MRNRIAIVVASSLAASIASPPAAAAPTTAVAAVGIPVISAIFGHRGNDHARDGEKAMEKALKEERRARKRQERWRPLKRVRTLPPDSSRY